MLQQYYLCQTLTKGDKKIKKTILVNKKPSLPNSTSMLCSHCSESVSCFQRCVCVTFLWQSSFGSRVHNQAGTCREKMTTNLASGCKTVDYYWFITNANVVNCLHGEKGQAKDKKTETSLMRFHMRMTKKIENIIHSVILPQIIIKLKIFRPIKPIQKLIIMSFSTIYAWLFWTFPF